MSEFRRILEIFPGRYEDGRVPHVTGAGGFRCPHCNGYGYSDCEKTGYEEYGRTVCRICKGSGRLRVRITEEWEADTDVKQGKTGSGFMEKEQEKKHEEALAVLKAAYGGELDKAVDRLYITADEVVDRTMRYFSSGRGKRERERLKGSLADLSGIVVLMADILDTPFGELLGMAAGRAGDKIRSHGSGKEE